MRQEIGEKETFILGLIFTEFFKMKKILFILMAIVLLNSCDSRTYEEISDNTPITITVKYTSDVKPIIEANCIACHSAGGSAAYQPLKSYDQVKMQIDNILDRIQRPNGDPQKMPQGSALSQPNIEIIKKWKSDGLLE